MLFQFLDVWHREFRVYLRSGRLTHVDCAYMSLEFLLLQEKGTPMGL